LKKEVPAKHRVPGDCARPVVGWAVLPVPETDVKIAAPSITFGPQHAPSNRMLIQSANGSRA